MQLRLEAQRTDVLLKPFRRSVVQPHDEVVGVDFGPEARPCERAAAAHEGAVVHRQLEVGKEVVGGQFGHVIGADVLAVLRMWRGRGADGSAGGGAGVSRCHFGGPREGCRAPGELSDAHDPVALAHLVGALSHVHRGLHDGVLVQREPAAGECACEGRKGRGTGGSTRKGRRNLSRKPHEADSYGRGCGYSFPLPTGEDRPIFAPGRLTRFARRVAFLPLMREPPLTFQAGKFAGVLAPFLLVHPCHGAVGAFGFYVPGVPCLWRNFALHCHRCAHV